MYGLKVRVGVGSLDGRVKGGLRATRPRSGFGLGCAITLTPYGVGLAGLEALGQHACCNLGFRNWGYRSSPRTCVIKASGVGQQATSNTHLLQQQAPRTGNTHLLQVHLLPGALEDILELEIPHFLCPQCLGRTLYHPPIVPLCVDFRESARARASEGGREDGREDGREGERGHKGGRERS